MARTNVPVVYPAPKTAEGGAAARITPEQQLRRLVMGCLLWEDVHYIDGESTASLIQKTVPLVKPQNVAVLAWEARNKMKLRHVPLLLARELARGSAEAKHQVSSLLYEIIQRPDEISEFLSIYWKDGKQPLSAQVKKGLAAAFTKFDEYALAKYDQDGAVKLRDVMFLCHAKPETSDREILYTKIADRTLATPDTWEVSLSAGANKRETFERLISESKLGALALLRNLRNMTEADVPLSTIRTALDNMNTERVLPFRFITAAKYAPKLEPELEKAMFRCVAQQPKLAGKTILVVDTSGSMSGGGNVSKKSELTRLDAAAALAILIREVAEEPVIYCTAGNDAYRTHSTGLIPARRGFALRDYISGNDVKLKLGGGGIFLRQALDYIYTHEKTADRIIVLTDEQDCDTGERSPNSANAFGKRNYLINVSVETQGIGYKPKFLHIDGFSEAVIDYIQAVENSNN